MKKLARSVTLILTLIFAFTFFGCSTPDQVLDLEAVKPWETIEKYEKSVYKVEKYTLKKEGGVNVKNEVIATGTYTSIIEMDVRTDEGSAVSRVSTSLEITYNNSEAAVEQDGATKIDHRGKTDTMTSMAEFHSAGLVPISATKEFKLEPRKDETSNRSYLYNADYKTFKATMTIFGKTTDMSFPSNGLDNEQLYMVTRALKTTAPNASGVFYMTNILDSYLNPALTRYAMSTTTKEAVTSFEVSPNLNKFITAGEDGKYKVDCLETDVGINSQTSGPRIKMLITEPKTKFATGSRNTSKIIMQFSQREYDLNEIAEKYETQFTLDDYTIEKAA